MFSSYCIFLALLQTCASTTDCGLNGDGQSTCPDQTDETTLLQVKVEQLAPKTHRQAPKTHRRRKAIKKAAVEDGVSYDVVWRDEFDVPGKIDQSKWSAVNKGGGFWNKELQFYSNREKNAWVSDGTLKIRAVRENYDGHKYTSAKLESKAEWTYGKFHVRARLNKGSARGTWPAHWMMPRVSTYGNWPGSGEIDIMEHVGYETGHVHGTVHTLDYNHRIGTQIGGTTKVNVADWHTYTVDWRPDIVVFSCDGEAYNTFRKQSDKSAKWPFNQDFYLILNMAVGGNWGGVKGVDENAFRGEGQIMEIDWVRVEQKRNGDIPSPTPSPPPSGGCCKSKSGGSCQDCGNDGSGWCHKSASNCGQCKGRFDSGAPSPTCSPTQAPAPPPSGGGCCKTKSGGSCKDCGNDGSGWCHKSTSNCGQCNGRFDSGAPSPTCSPTPAPAPPPSGGGCCKTKSGGSCQDCGKDGSGWCHKKKKNCGQCNGRFDSGAPAPTCS